MERTKSLLVRNAVFGALAAAFVALLVLRSEAVKPSRDAEGEGPALPSVAVDKVKAVEFERTTKVDGKDVKESVRLVRSGTDWRLASSFDHPATGATVESYLKRLAGVKRHAEPTRNPAKFAEFAGPDGFQDVRVFEGDGAPTLSFGIGKGSPVDWSRKFLRLDDAGGIAAAGGAKGGRVLDVSDLDTDSLTSPTHWIEPRLLPTLTSAEIAELRIERGGETPLTLEFKRQPKKDPKDRDGEEPWALVQPTSEPALKDPVMSVVRGFSGLQLASIEAGGATPADAATYGFDKPDLVIRGTGGTPVEGKPATWTITIGKKHPTKSAWYAKRSTGMAGDAFVYTVNDYDLTDFRRDASAYVEKKPEPAPAPDAGMDGAGMDGAGMDGAGMDGAGAGMDGGMDGAGMDAGGGAPPAPATPPTAPPAMGEAPPAPDAPAPAMEGTPPAPPTPNPDAPPPAPSGMGEVPPAPAETPTPK